MPSFEKWAQKQQQQKGNKPQQQRQQLLYSTCNSERKTIIGSNTTRVFWKTEQTKALV